MADVVIYAATQPTVRPPALGGGPLEVGDIWFRTGPLGGTVHRWDGAVFYIVRPVVISSTNAPSVRPATVGGGALQIGDLWLHSSTGAYNRWDGVKWSWLEPHIGTLPVGGSSTHHLEKFGDQTFESRWVPPEAGIVFMQEQRTPAQQWVINHMMRSTAVAVTVVSDETGNTMIPDIDYRSNTVLLNFAKAVTGFAVVYASGQTPNRII